MSYCPCCDERLLPSVEPCDCSGNYCDRCVRCMVHCRCRDEGSPYAELVSSPELLHRGAQRVARNLDDSAKRAV